MEISLEAYSNYLHKSGKSKKTIKFYSQLIKNYFRFTGQLIIGEKRLAFFLHNLEKEKYSISYRRAVYYALKSYCKYKKITWEEGNCLFLPKNREEEESGQDFDYIASELKSKPVFTVDQVKQLIYMVRREKNIFLNGYLLFSTIYGLRVSELAAIRQADVDFDNNLFFVKTAKGGVRTTHLFPFQIHQHVDINFEFIHTQRLSDHFKDICQSAKVEIGLQHGWGWHAIRRTLVTELLKLGHRESDIHSFMRWKGGKESSMVERYNVPDHIGLDRKILMNHPFVRFWI